MMQEYKRILSSAGVLCIAALATSCGDPNSVLSENVETNTIWAGINIEAKGDGTTDVNVELNENGSTGNSVRLSSGERLEAAANGLVVVLNEDQDFLDIDYEGSIPTDASNTQITISLIRADGTVLNGSRATLPGRFDVSTPVNGQEYTVGDIVDILWSPAGGGSIDLALSTQCSGRSSSEFLDISDNGRYVVNTAALRGILDPAIARENGCTFTATLTRENRGSIDPSFRGGGFNIAVQQRSVQTSLVFQ